MMKMKDGNDNNYLAWRLIWWLLRLIHV